MMKVITDYFSPPTGKKATGASPPLKEQTCGHRLRTPNRCPSKTFQDDPNENEDETFYETRKIKIRLADPNVADSYICEVYDTSPSWEDEEDTVEVLESNEKVTKCNDETTVLLADSKRKVKTKTNNGRQAQKRRRSQAKARIQHDCDDSSSDEALVVVKKRLIRSCSTSICKPSRPEGKQVDNVSENNSAHPKRSLSKRSAADAPSPRKSPARELKELQELNDKINKKLKMQRTRSRELEKQAGEALSDIKNGRLERWRSVIRENCARPVPADNSATSPASEVQVETSKNGIVKNKETRPEEGMKGTTQKSCADSVENTRRRSKRCIPEVSEEREPPDEVDGRGLDVIPENGGPPRENSLSKNNLKATSKRSSVNVNSSANNRPKSAEKGQAPNKRGQSEEKTDNSPHVMSSENGSVPNKVSQPKGKSKKLAKSQAGNSENSTPSERPKRSISGIKKYFASTENSTPDAPQAQKAKTRQSVKLSAKEQALKYEEERKSMVILSPTKKCSVVLDKTEILTSPHRTPSKENCLKRTVKSPMSSPTMDCSVVLEKLTPAVKARNEVVKSDVPLAPIFLKKDKTSERKSTKGSQKLKAVDPEVVKARQAFLKSGVPAFIRKKTETSSLEDIEVPFFPSVSHVQQRLGEDQWEARKVDLSLLPPQVYPNGTCSWRKIQRDMPMKPEAIDIQKSDTSVDLEKLKSAYKNLNIDEMYEILKDRHEECKQLAPDLLPMWTEKYKPESRGVLSNDRTVHKLRKWLTCWKLYGQELRDGVRRRESRDGGSSDDFVSSDEEGSRQRAPITACLLHGPSSSGKTALVQALAVELDLQVLEVNSSSKRSGKKMLSDLQEATQSHKIVQEVGGSVGRTGDAMSVIVVEEVDVMFEEHDEGFVSGLQNLISAAKRPVVMLTSDITATHLEKIRSSGAIQLSMDRASLKGACAVMELICLLEGYQVTRSMLIRLLRKNEQDLRKSLLELQFWIENDASRLWPVMISQPLSASRLWWASQKLTKKSEQDDDFSEISEESSEKSATNKGDLKRFRSFAESMTVLDTISPKCAELFALDKCSYRVKDGMSLDFRDVEENAQHLRLAHEIQTELQERISRLLPQTDDIPMQASAKESRWLSQRRRASEELLHIVPSVTSPAGIYCDYLPTLREICRTEKTRVVTNTKRRNRFYHYLRTLGANPTQTNLDINCSVLSKTDGESLR